MYTYIFYAQGVKANVLFFERKPASETPWTRQLWIYDLRTNQNFTLRKINRASGWLPDKVAFMSSTADLLNRLRYFVQAEAETQYATLDRQWFRPLAERVAKGWAIEGLRVEHFEKGLIRLHCDTNDSRFREGDLLVLHRGSPQDIHGGHAGRPKIGVHLRGGFAQDHGADF